MIKICGVNISEREVDEPDLAEDLWEEGQTFSIAEYDLYIDRQMNFIMGELKSEVETGVIKYFDVKIYFDDLEDDLDMRTLIDLLNDTQNNKLLGILHAMAGMIHNNTF